MNFPPPLPSAWTYVPIKRAARLRFSSVDKHSLPDEVSTRLCNYVDVYRNERIAAKLDFMVATATPSEIARFSLAAGDVLLTKDSETPDDIGVPACVAEPLPGVICGYHLAMLRPGPGLDGRFLHRALQAHGIRDQFHSKANGVTRFAIGLGDVGDSLIPLPPLDTQRAIADFLDRKTAAIDALIEQKEHLALALEDERQAVIAKAVTQGVRPSVLLADSGLPWLGQVASHWGVVELRRIVRPGTSITYGIVQAGPHVEDGVPYIRTSDMAGDLLPLDGYGKTSHEIDSAYRRSKVAAGDVVVAIRATVGKALVVPAGLAGANLTQGTAKVSPGPRVLSDYLWYALRSAPSVQRFEALAKGVTFREITLDMLRRFQIPLPPLVEQEEICRYLADEDERLLACRRLLEQSCERFRDYRQGLITAAVTGQLDVTKGAA